MSWWREAWSRMRILWGVKMAGTIIFMVVFFMVYFWLLNHPRFPLTTIPTIFIDRMIAFRPGALYLYISLWFYVVIAPALLRTWREMRAYLIASVALGLLGFAIFYLWPTTVATSEVSPSAASSLAYLKTVDASGNAFPSLHVAFALFTALWLERLLLEMGAGIVPRAVNWVWFLGIVYSTMAIRQHVALDVAAGGILGALVAAVHMRLLGGPVPGTPAATVSPT